MAMASNDLTANGREWGQGTQHRWNHYARSFVHSRLTNGPDLTMIHGEPRSSYITLKNPVPVWLGWHRKSPYSLAKFIPSIRA